MKRVSWYCAFGILLTGIVNLLNGAAIYGVTDLGNNNIGVALNDVGQIAGNAYDPATNTSRPFLYSNGQFTYFGSGSNYALGINNLGQVVGDFFVYRDGQLTTLSVSPPRSGTIHAEGISDSGLIVGYQGGAPFEGTTSRSFIYTNGQIMFQGSNDAYRAVNNLGQITGVATNPAPLLGGPGEAFIRDANGIRFLGTLGAFGTSQQFSNGNAINDHGDVAGYSTNSVDGDYHAFLYRNGTMIDLGVIPGGSDFEALGINDLDQVVGRFYAFDAKFGTNAFLYTDGATQNLDDLIDPALGITFIRAFDINNYGQIVANGADSLGQQHGYLLTPLATPVPEPTTIGSLFVGLLALGFAFARSAFRSL